MRARRTEREFANWLLDVGSGRTNRNATDTPPDSISVPEQCIVPNVIEAVFGEHPWSVSLSAIMAPKNENALLLNSLIVGRLPGIIREYFGAGAIVSDDDEEAYNYPQEFINA